MHERRGKVTDGWERYLSPGRISICTCPKQYPTHDIDRICTDGLSGAVTPTMGDEIAGFFVIGLIAQHQAVLCRLVGHS